MLNHEQIINAKFVRMPGGAVVDMNPFLAEQVVVMTEQSVGNGYYNLLRAASFLYQTVQLHSVAIQQMIDTCEEQGQDNLVPGLLSLLQGLDIGKQVAVVGIEEVARRLNYTKT